VCTLATSHRIHQCADGQSLIRSIPYYKLTHWEQLKTNRAVQCVEQSDIISKITYPFAWIWKTQLQSGGAIGKLMRAALLLGHSHLIVVYYVQQLRRLRVWSRWTAHAQLSYHADGAIKRTCTRSTRVIGDTKVEVNLKFRNVYSGSESYYLYIGKAFSAPLC